MKQETYNNVSDEANNHICDKVHTLSFRYDTEKPEQLMFLLHNLCLWRSAQVYKWQISYILIVTFCLSVTCNRSVVFSDSPCFLHQ